MAHPHYPPQQPPETDERLVALLLRLGAGDDEARRAVAHGRGGDLALELNLRTAPPLTVEEVLAATGKTREAFLRFTHALGLTVPADGVAGVPADVVASVPVVSEAINSWLGEEPRWVSPALSGPPPHGSPRHLSTRSASTTRCPS